MADMRRINERFRPCTTMGANDAFRKFSFQFRLLLNPDDTPRDDEEFEKLYVKDEAFETEITDFQRNPRNAATCVVGYTGIGKSTSLRHCYSMGVRKTAFINNKQLVFPTFLDGYQITNETSFDITSRIRSVCTDLREQFPDLILLMKTKEGKEEFYQFIRKHTPRILEGTDSIDEFDWDRDETIENKLREAEKQFKYQFFASLLKFYIYKHNDEINELVIILDDIESLPDNFQEETIHSYMKLYECMKNTEYPANRDYSVKLIVSLRPHTNRKYIESRLGETFGVGAPILKRHSVSIKQIFTNRFDYYTELSNNKIGDPESWMVCRKVLDSINDQFDGKYMEMISKLCFYNVRLTLKWYSAILANRFWVQKNVEKQAAFTLYEENFDFNNVNIIRALACQENEVYFENPNGIIPNILLTTCTEDQSVLSLMIATYFDKKTEFDSYGSDDRTQTIKGVIDFWKYTCGNEIEQTVRTIIDYLFDIRVLRKSIRNKEELMASDDHRCLNDDSVLYISPRGSELLQMLIRDSIYLEMIREAAWRDYEFVKFDDRTSYELMSERKLDAIYEDLMKYILYLCEKEEDILRKIKNLRKSRQYVSVMGNNPVCYILLQGVRKSMSYTGSTKDNEMLRAQFQEVEQRINALKELLE